LLHRTDDLLPDYKDIQQIERIELSFQNDKVILDEESEMSNLVRLLSLPWEKEIFRKTNSPIKRVIATVTIYYKDYPAYQRIGSLIQAEDGSYGLVIRAFVFPFDGEYQTRCDYIPIPQNSPFLYYLQV